MDYVRGHDTQVSTEYAAIPARIENGNPAQVEERLPTNREKVKARLRLQTTSREPIRMQQILSDPDVQGQVSRLMDICQMPP